MAAKIKYVKRGGAAAVTIPQQDLAATDNLNEIQPLLTLERTQESDLPKVVQVSYINQAADYRQGVQISQRMTGNSIEQIGIDVQIAMSDDYAKQICDAIMYNAWTARNAFELSLSTKYRYIEPTDIIGIELDNASHTLLVLKTDDGQNGVIKLQCVAEEASQYVFTSVGGPSVVDDTVLYALSKTRLLLLDIALLLDSDEGSGIYVAAGGFNAGWHGCVLYKSSDGGEIYTKLAAITSGPHFGSTVDALGSGRTDIFDESSAVTIVLPYGGECSSATELAVLNGANPILIGDEVLQYKNAELLEPGRYKLTGLLRGRRGTEWAVSSHASGERAVLLTTDLTRLGVSTGDQNSARIYKGVTFGDSLQSTLANTFTYLNIGQKCYAPVHCCGISVNATGDALLRWVRRTRINGAWNDYVDAQLGETLEQYEIDIYDASGVVVASKTVNDAQEYSYLRSEQLTDFTVPQWAKIFDNTIHANGADYVYSMVKFGDSIAASFGLATSNGTVALFDGAIWTTIFTESGYETVQSLCVMNGVLYCGTGDSSGDGDVWQYSGSGAIWTKIGGDSLNGGWTTGIDGVYSLATDGTYLYAGTGISAGEADVWRWDGASWTQIGGDGLNSGWAGATYEKVANMCCYGGILYAGLGDSASDAEVWSWDGSAWTKIGGDSVNSGWATGYETAFTLHHDGTYLYAGLGSSAGDGEVWRWNGSAWTKIGGDTLNSSWSSSIERVYSLCSLNGYLYAGIGNSTADVQLWQWNGTVWAKIGGDGVNGGWPTPTSSFGSVSALLGDESAGYLYAGIYSSDANDASIWKISDPSDPVPATVNFDVYQMSSVTGRGYAGRGQLIR